MTRIAIIQSNYIPWCGYFDIIAHSDKFVFLDDVQYTRSDWRNRNLIKTPVGAKWLSVPCGSSVSRTIDEVTVLKSDWAAKHWKTISRNYSNSPYFPEMSPIFETLYSSWDSPVLLSTINQTLIRVIAREILELKCEFYSSRDLNLRGDKTERLAKIISALDGDVYLSGPSAKSYIDEDNFKKRRVKVAYVNYPNYGPYPQNYGAFVPNLSILDAIFNLGQNVSSLIGKSGFYNRET